MLRTSLSADVTSNSSAGKYLFNDLYDTEVIRNIIRKYYGTLYNMNLAIQKNVCHNDMYFGTMGMFKHNAYFNELEKIPIDAYTCFLPAHIIPYYTKKLYYDKYDGEAISLIDIMWDDKVFIRRCVFTVGEFVFFQLYMKPVSNGTLIYILPDKNKGMSKDSLEDFITRDVQWSIRFESQGLTGYTYKRKGLIFQNGVVPAKVLDWNTMYDYRKINVWKSYMSSSREDVNLLCQAQCTYDKDGDYYVYSAPYIEHALSHIENCKIYIVNQKFFDGFSTLPEGMNYFRIPIEDGQSPVPIGNIRIFEYDENTDKFSQMFDANIQMHYPNVYTFERSDSGLTRVEWDRLDNITNVEFVNEFKDYIDYVGEDTFVDQVINGTLPEPWNSFNPSPETYPDINEFLKGDWDSLDDYYVDKIKDILNEHSNLFPDILEDLLKPSKPKDDLIIEVPNNPDIPDNVTNNNGDAVNDPDDTEVWDELFVYVTITNTTNEPYDVTVTVDGVFTEIDHTYIKDGLQYIYIPAELVKPDSVISITIHDCPKESESGDISFKDTESAVPLPPNLGNVSAQSLLFYEKRTRQYLDIKLIQFYLKAEDTYIPGNIGANEDDYELVPPTTTADGKGFVTKDGKLFRVLTTTRVKDRSCYLLDIDKETLLTFYREPLVLYNDFVVVPGPEVDDGFSKLIPSDDLEVRPKEPALVGMRIGVVTTNVHRIYKYEDVRFVDTVTIPEFKLDPSNTRFKVYLNGILAIEGIDYEYTPQKLFGDDAVFHLINQTYVTNKTPVKLIIEYLPFRSKRVYYGKDIISFNHDNSKVYIELKDVLTLPVMKGVTEVFINGIRIPDKMIRVMENTRVVIDVKDLESLGIDTDEEMLVTVYEEKHDQDLYNYNDTQGGTLNGSYMENDEAFKEWLLSLK